MANLSHEREQKRLHKTWRRVLPIFIATVSGVVVAGAYLFLAVYVWEKVRFLRNPGPEMGFLWAVAWFSVTWFLAFVVLVSSEKRAYRRLDRFFFGAHLLDDS